MSETGHIDESGDHSVLAGEYVLGLLDAAQHAAFAARLRIEPELRADVHYWSLRLGQLDAGFAETPAPSAVWSRLERRLFAADTPPAGLWHSLALWRGLTGLAAAVAVVAIGLNLAMPRPDPNAFAAQLVAALSAQGSNVQVVALYNAQSGQVRLTALSGDKVPDKDYELWAIEGSASPKSLGVIKIDSRTDVRLPADVLAEFGSGTTLAITLEPLGGSPGPGPTGPVVAAGKATPI